MQQMVLAQCNDMIHARSADPAQASAACPSSPTPCASRASATRASRASPATTPATTSSKTTRTDGEAGPGRPAALCAQDRRRVVRLGTRGSAGACSSGARRRSRSRDLGRDDLRLRRPVLPAVASPGWRGAQGLERPTGRNLVRPLSSPRPARPTVVARRPHVLPHLHGGPALARAWFCRMNCQMFSWLLSSGARGGSGRSEILLGTFRSFASCHPA